jgi:hypothetical protein
MTTPTLLSLFTGLAPYALQATAMTASFTGGFLVTGFVYTRLLSKLGNKVTKCPARIAPRWFEWLDEATVLVAVLGGIMFTGLSRPLCNIMAKQLRSTHFYIKHVNDKK